MTAATRICCSAQATSSSSRMVLRCSRPLVSSTARISRRRIVAPAAMRLNSTSATQSSPSGKICSVPFKHTPQQAMARIHINALTASGRSSSCLSPSPNTGLLEPQADFRPRALLICAQVTSRAIAACHMGRVCGLTNRPVLQLHLCGSTSSIRSRGFEFCQRIRLRRIPRTEGSQSRSISYMEGRLHFRRSGGV
jgi:hypothetical protein